MASILDLVKHYQHAIEKYPNDEQKILKSIDKLFNLGVTVQHLQETGVGRTVNALRKEPGDVGQAARALVYKWKVMVAAEESDHDEDHNQSSSCNGHENGKNPEDSDYDGNHKQNQYNKYDSTEKEQESYSSYKYINGDHCGSKRKHQSSEEEELNVKKSKHAIHNEVQEKISQVIVKREPSETDPESASFHSDEDRSSHFEDSESYEEDKSNRHRIKTEHDKSSSSSTQPIKKEKHIRDSSSGKSHENHENVNKQSKHSHSESRHKREKSSNDSSSSDKYKKEKDSSSRKNDSLDQSSDKDKKKKESTEESSRKHSSSSEKHKSKTHSDKKSSKSEKTSSSSQKESDKNKHKDKHLSEKSSEKHKSREHSSSKEKHHSSSKEKHHSSSKEKTKEKSHSSKDKENSHKSDKKHSSSSDTVAKENSSRSKSEKTDDKKKHSHDKDKKSHSKSSHSSKSSKSSSSKSKDTPKKKTPKKNQIVEDGIDCGSGASFAEALGMISPSKPKKKSLTPKDLCSPNNSSSNDDNSMGFQLTPAALLAPNAQLAPLPMLEISALPDISPNYKPRPPPKFLPHFNDEDAISAGISSKNQRTKVYSGNKVLGKIPTLYEMCVQILQEHIDALEYTGGVPYEILKPVVDRATPEQLYMLEHYNPYLMEDTDHLWQKFCEKKFRNKKRQELESWREMYIRCQEEQENRLKSLTANIRIAQEAKKAPIKQTKMAYVDTVVKPPRSVARKQAQHGTAFAASASPAARVAALAAAPNVLKGSARPAPLTTVPSATFQKPKKAPLMQKALQFMRGRKR